MSQSGTWLGIQAKIGESSSFSSKGRAGRRVWRWTLCLALLIAGIAIEYKGDVDFRAFYKAAVLTHVDPGQVYEPHTDAGRFFYAPSFLVGISPLGRLSLDTARIVWITVQSLCFVLFFAMLAKLYPFINTSGNGWAWIGLFILSINPIHNCFQSNNVQLFLCAFLMLAEHLTRRRSALWQGVGGALCAYIAVLKVFPLLVAAYYFVGRGRAVRTGVIAGIGLSVLVPILFFGTDTASLYFADFFNSLGGYQRDNSLVTTAEILSVPSLIVRVLSPFYSEHGRVAGAVVKACVLAVASVYLLWAFRTRETIGRDEVGANTMWALAMALSVLLCPATRPHYFMFYVPAFAAIFQSVGKISTAATIGTAVSILLVAFTTDGLVGKALNNQLELLSVPTFGFILLCVITAGVARRNARPAYI